MESEQIQIESQCGGILLDHPFYFEWGLSIENSQENKCLWTIQEADDGYITLVDFMEFDIPADVGIFNIYLDKLLPNNFYASYSGSSLPPVIETSSQIIIQFIGLAEVEAYFRLDIAYERRRSHTLASDVVGSCGGKLTAASGYIASPSWPSPYPGDQEWVK